MIEANDLKAAVSVGILTEAQASQLKFLSQNRQLDGSELAIGDEPFELFRGFNEVFIIVGLVVLTTGWVSAIGAVFADRIANIENTLVLASVLSAPVIWLLSEYFIRRRRMVGPAIALSLMWAGNAIFGFTAGLSQYFMVGQGNFESLPLPFALGILATVLFWLRFKVPFAMAIIAVGAFLLAILIAAVQNGTPQEPQDLFLLSSAGPFAWITLLVGFITFGFAMYFDMSDPHRVTRRSSQGFWLHVVAAPALTNTIALTLFDADTALAYLALALFLTLLACVAIIIDRRSFLITTIGYIMALAATLFDTSGIAFFIILLGLFLLLLGAFWDRIRARLVAALPGFLPRERLPPILINEGIS
ncbi:MAG: hypothetical protein ACSHXD_02195 [Marinosulfonomonas sp.]